MKRFIFGLCAAGAILALILLLVGEYGGEEALPSSSSEGLRLHEIWPPSEAPQKKLTAVDQGEEIQRSHLQAAFSGLLLWADQVPAADVVLRSVDETMDLGTVSTDASGRFELLLNASQVTALGSYKVAVRAPCWRHDRVVTLEPSAAAEQDIPSGEKRGLAWAPTILPLEVDLSVALPSEPSLWERLKRAGYRHAEVRLKPGHGSVLERAMAPPLAHLSLEQSGDAFVGEATIPLQDSIYLVAFLRGELVGELTQQVLEAKINLSRNKPAQFAASISKDRLIMGQVVDHLGQPVSEVNLELFEAGVEGAPPPKSRLALSPKGAFAYFGSGIGTVSVHYHGSERTEIIKSELAFGSLDVEITIDLSQYKRFRFHREGRPIEAYRLGVPPPLIAETVPTTLPWHEAGLGWWPRSRGKDREPVLIAWIEDGQRYTEAISMPEANEAGLLDLDANDVSKVPNGTIRVACGDVFPEERVVVTFLRIEPAAPPYSGHGIQVQRARDESGTATAEGLPPGWYEVEVGVPVVRGPQTLKKRCELKGNLVEIGF